LLGGFFDREHYGLKDASWATGALIRRSFRNPVPHMFSLAFSALAPTAGAFR